VFDETKNYPITVRRFATNLAKGGLTSRRNRRPTWIPHGNRLGSSDAAQLVLIGGGPGRC
jgi:hypothetical protein